MTCRRLWMRCPSSVLFNAMLAAPQLQLAAQQWRHQSCSRQNRGPLQTLHIIFSFCLSQRPGSGAMPSPWNIAPTGVVSGAMPPSYATMVCCASRKAACPSARSGVESFSESLPGRKRVKQLEESLIHLLASQCAMAPMVPLASVLDSDQYAPLSGPCPPPYAP